jgi:FeS assembly protein SufD
VSATTFRSVASARSWVEASRASEPRWLADRRLEAIDLFERAPMPDPLKDEEWRRMVLTGLDLERRSAGSPDSVKLSYDGGKPPAGVEVRPITDAAEDEPALRDLLAAGAVPASRGKFEALSAALFHSGFFVRVAKGVEVKEPIALTLRATPSGDGSGIGAFRRNVILLEPGASASILFIEESVDAAGLVCAATEVYLREGARLRQATIQTLGPQVWSFDTRRALVGRDATIEWVSCELGGKTSRSVMESHLGEQGGRAEARSMIFANGRQHVDVAARMIHVARNTTSDMLVRAALAETSRAVYRGHVDIKRGAKGTDSQQKEAVLLLSPEARSDAIPSLFIDENDVKAGHGATAGRVDEKQVFYLMSRGLRRKAAEKLVVHGFFAPLLERIAIEPLVDELNRRIDGKIGA